MKLAISLAAALAAALAAGCIRPGEERAREDLDVGAAAISDADVQIDGGLAAIRALADHRLELWSQAPALGIHLSLLDTAAGDWTITVRNATADAVLSAGGIVYTREPGQRPTVATFRVPLGAGAHHLQLGPPDAAVPGPFQIAAMADIQTALPAVDEVFRAISAVPGLRFVVGMGDLTERGELAEYELFERQLEHLELPFYTTIGNHELWADAQRFLGRYGRANFHFQFKGVAFSFADSGDGGIDPLVEEWLAGWLEAAREQPHIFLTHMPPVDPLGIRYGSFRSTRDGRRLLSQLAEGAVDLTLYGHIHTFIEFDNAGIPAYVSGGGGADPMKLDGIERHFLVLDLDAAGSGIGPVSVHRVD